MQKAAYLEMTLERQMSWSAAFSPDGNFVATGSVERVGIRLWQVGITQADFLKEGEKRLQPVQPVPDESNKAEDIFKLPWMELQIKPNWD